MPIEITTDLRTVGGASALGSPLAWPRRIGTPKIAGDVSGTALATLALAASRIYFVPFAVPRVVVLSGLRISVTSAAVGAANLGIYENELVSGNDKPHTRLAQLTATLDTGTTGDKTGSFASNQTLEPGRIYWAALIGSAAASLRALAVASVQTSLGRQVNNTGVISHVYVAGSGSTLPATVSAVTDGTGSVPAIYLIEV